MKRKGKIIARVLIFSSFSVAVATVKAQDVHLLHVPDMNIWYNPALKTNKIALAHLSYHNVTYPDILSYTSTSATVELPLMRADKDPDDPIPYANLAAGMNADNSSERFMNVTTAFLSFSYALPLNFRGSYLSIGFQGKYTTSRVGDGNIENFPKHFDQYGAFGAAIANNPYQDGYSFGYFTAGTGVAVFHTTRSKEWYIGASLHHFNHPYTESGKTTRLATAYCLLAGYKKMISETDAVGASINFNWQDNIHENFINVLYTHNLNDSGTFSVSPSLGFRFNDAVIPGATVNFGRNHVAFYYEFNAPGAGRRNYARRGYTIFYRIDL